MDQRPSILSIPLWENYKQDMFCVIREALKILQQQSILPMVEQSSKNPNLNRDFYKCIRKICSSQIRFVYHLPVYEGQNLPGQDAKPTESESKRPDFYWHIANPLASEDETELRFVLECKRLGALKSSDGFFNELYILNGVCRFLTNSHEYGKGDDEGGMVGYVQDMEFDDILREINEAINKSPVKDLAVLSPPQNGWIEDGISELEHILERPFPVSPFRLRHFWVDIRRS